VKSYSRSHVADEVLLRNCADRHAHDRSTIAELLADIGEIEARSLHLKAGYKSLHAFCMAEYSPASVRAIPVRHEVKDSSGFVVPERQSEPRPRIEPIAPQKFRAEFTMTQEMHDDLRYAQALDSHAVPSGDIAKIFHRALRSHIARVKKRKFAATSKPRPGRTSINRRTIPANVKRQVVERDQSRCAYVSASGRRCNSCERLEFDHIEPVARNGAATVANIRLLCRAHNQLAAEEAFGAEFIECKRHEAHEKRSRNDDAIQDRDVIPWLRALGIRADDARKAAAHCESIPNAPLKERVRLALTHCGPRGTIYRPAPSAAAP